MRPLRLVTWLALAALVPCMAAAQVPPVTILVDGSASMRGYGDHLETLVETLREESGGRAFVFTHFANRSGRSTGGVREYARSELGRGTLTLLWRGLSEYLEQYGRGGELVAMITDNVQDAGAHPEEQRDVADFYRELARAQRLGTVYVLPMRLPFDGTLYGQHGAGAIGHYIGDRGLVIYLIAHGDVPAAAVSGGVRRVAGRVGAEPVRMKPYRDAPLRIEVDTAASRRAATADSCASEPLFPAAGEEGVLARRDPVSPGRPFGGVVVLRLTSELEGVSLRQPRITASLLEDFKLADFRADGEPVVEASPPRLQTTFSPGEEATVTVSLCFPRGVVFDASASSLRRFIVQRDAHGSYEGQVRVQLHATREDLGLEETVRQRYSTTDPAFFTRTDRALHERVYGLEWAFRQLAPDAVTIEGAVDHRLRFSVLYPKWPAFLLIGGLLGLGVATMGLIAWMLRGRRYRLERNGPSSFYFEAVRERPKGHESDLHFMGELRANGGEPGGFRLRAIGRYPVHLDGSEVAAIRWIPLVGPWVTARPGYRVDGARRARMLADRGTSFELVLAEIGPRDRESDAAPEDEILDPSRL